MVATLNILKQGNRPVEPQFKPCSTMCAANPQQNTGVERILWGSTPDLHANAGNYGDLPPGVAAIGVRGPAGCLLLGLLPVRDERNHQ